MNYSVFLYVIFTFVGAFAVSGINFDGFIKSGKEKEAKVLAISLSFALGYLLTKFVIDFLSLTTVI